MELRSCSHFHYIRAIKAGLMTKVLNVNSRGKPAVTFKKVADIYGIIDGIAHKSLPATWSKDGLGESIPDRVEKKVESTQVLYAERKLIKYEPEVSDYDSGGDTDGQKSDNEVDSMTLKEIMEGCKKRKLMQLKSVDSSMEKLKTCSRQKLNHTCLLSDEDDSDLSVALSLWKTKLSKRKKINTKCKGGRISTVSQCGQIIGKSDPINSDQDLLPSSSDLPIPVDIKVEIRETDVAEIPNTYYISEKLPLFCDEDINLCLSAEPVGADELLLNRGLTTSRNEGQYCALNRACHEYLEGDDPEPRQMVRALSPEHMDKDNLNTQEPHYSDFPPSEAMEGQCAVSYSSNDGISEATSLTEEQDSDIYISQGKSSIHEVPCQNNNEVRTHLHGMSNLQSLQSSEMSHGDEVCLTENDYKDELTLDREASISTDSTSGCRLGPDQLLLSVDKSPAKEKQSQVSDYSDIKRNSSHDFHLCESMDDFNQFQDPKRPPARLLSTRTTISPTSQERLSKAMESMQLQDKECKTCGGKPYFKQTKYKVGIAEECDQMKRLEFDRSHEQNIRKSKKRSFNSTSTTKIPHVSTGSTAVQSCSDSVIAFTQRQMQDIEGVALKLTNQLKSMKAIAEDRLHVEGNKATTFKFNMDEVRTAIADATRVEANARKWLSIMTRDCNRFCKIMKATENGSTASQSVIHKVKKKITFADEAGGKLCQVRLIEDDVESFTEPNPEKYEMVK